jgi:hypothetical protein
MKSSVIEEAYHFLKSNFFGERELGSQMYTLVILHQMVRSTKLLVTTVSQSYSTNCHIVVEFYPFIEHSGGVLVYL